MMSWPLFLKDFDVKVDAPLKQKPNKIRYFLSWSPQRKQSHSTFNLEVMVKE